MPSPAKPSLSHRGGSIMTGLHRLVPIVGPGIIARATLVFGFTNTLATVVLTMLVSLLAPAVARDATALPENATSGFVGRWLDTTEADPGPPLEIVADGEGLWIEREGKRMRLEPLTGQADDDPAAGPAARVASHDGDAASHLRIERVEHWLLVEDGSGDTNRWPQAVYARATDFLPNGYRVFFASASEALLRKDGVNFNAAIAGPHVVELGNSGTVIFGRIDPQPGLPPHPDHAPGYFLIDSATDEVTTGLEREPWRAALEALGVEAPQLVPPARKWPQDF